MRKDEIAGTEIDPGNGISYPGCINNYVAVDQS